MMASNRDNKKEWFAKARVDYFSPFVNLWLACNSWYNFHYANFTKDRQQVDNLKCDTSKQNIVFQKFNTVFLGGSSKEQTSLFANIELLLFSLNRAEIKLKKLDVYLKLSTEFIDFPFNDNSVCCSDLIIKNAKTKKGALKARLKDRAVDLGEVVISNDSTNIFAVLLEIIYQVRCMLIHGELEPTNVNHEVVKYCYLILHDLMSDFCS